MDFNNSSVINLLISKVFHDLGNVSALLNFFVELNKENPKEADFSELEQINRRNITTIAVLKYAFLTGEQDENTFTNLKDYFFARKIELDLAIDTFCFCENSLKITVHTLMLLSKIVYSGAKISLQNQQDKLLFNCKAKEEIEKARLAIFDNLDAQENVSVIFLKSAMEKAKMKLVYKFLSDKDLMIEFKK